MYPQCLQYQAAAGQHQYYRLQPISQQKPADWKFPAPSSPDSFLVLMELRTADLVVGDSVVENSAVEDSAELSLMVEQVDVRL